MNMCQNYSFCPAFMKQYFKNIIFPNFNSFYASGNFCPLLITFANSLDPDQDQQNEKLSSMHRVKFLATLKELISSSVKFLARLTRGTLLCPA